MKRSETGIQSLLCALSPFTWPIDLSILISLNLFSYSFLSIYRLHLNIILIFPLFLLFLFFFSPSLLLSSLLFFFISLFISHTVTDMSVKPAAKPRSSSFNYAYLGLLVLFLPVCIGSVFLYVTCKDKRDDEIALNPKVFVPQLSQI